ncbi:MAG: peptide deformylase [Vicingaceae bacterium]
MTLPIIAYGDPILKKVAQEIEQDYPDLDEIIESMFETMYDSNGVGLAAPQINKSIRLFIIDAEPFAEEDPDLAGFKQVFINPIILKEEGSEWDFNEGCLSIPGIREDVKRKPSITIEYYDREFNLKEEVYEGVAARIIQHEYDHIEGVLFTDRINPLRRRLLSGKLKNIAKGKVEVDYKMKFPLK